MKTSLSLLLFLCIAVSAQAQINIQYSGSLKELLVTLRHQYGYKFMYSNDDVDDRQKMTVSAAEADMKSALEKVFGQIGISCEIKGKQVILKSEKPVDPDVVELSPVPVSNIPMVDTLPASLQMEPATALNALKSVSLLPPVEPETLPAPLQAQVNEKTAAQTGIEPNRNKAFVNNSPAGKIKSKSSLAIRNDFLYDLILTPNLGMEYKPVASVGIIVNGYWTHIGWGNGYKTYRLWAVAPEVRFYMTDSKRIYAGVMFQKGELNLKLNETGHQGYFIGGGVIIGYLMNLNERVKLDFGIGLGYTRYKYDSYQYIDGVNALSDSDFRNWWGPIKIGITLVWKII